MEGLILNFVVLYRERLWPYSGSTSATGTGFLLASLGM